MKPNIVIEISQHVWHNFGSQVMGQNAAEQSNYFLHADKHSSLQLVDTILFGE